jgi:hypothetical protein
MGKTGWLIILAFIAALAADRYVNGGRYTDNMVTTLKQMKRAVGF